MKTHRKERASNNEKGLMLAHQMTIAAHREKSGDKASKGPYGFAQRSFFLP